MNELEEDIESLSIRDNARERRENRRARRGARRGRNKITLPMWTNDANYDLGVATSNDVLNFMYSAIANPDHDMTMTLGDG